MADPADLVREACTLLAGYLPQLERETPEADNSGFAAPGMTGRPPAAPLPGNPAALFALTGIDATARQLEGVLKYAAGARRPGPLAVRGGSAANTYKALEAVTALFAAVEGDRDLEWLVIAELDRRLAETRSVPAIDEELLWRPLPKRPCPYCGYCWLRVLLDQAGRSTGHVECFTVRCADSGGLRPAGQITTDDRGRVILAWADGKIETAADLDG